MIDHCLSIIIPSRDDRKLLLILFDKLIELKIECSEIIVIDSSEYFEHIPGKYINYFESINIKFHHISKNALYPGASRNEGIKICTSEYIGFLDTKTLPNKNWKNIYYELVSNKEYDGVLGKTVYASKNYLEKIIIASSYGFLPLSTIPGSIFKKNKFLEVGYFLPKMKVSEDSEWLLRLNLHNFKLIKLREHSVSYALNSTFNFFSILKKWFKSYRSAQSAPHLKDHKAMYVFFFSILLIGFSLNWNWLFAKWDESSIFYINHVSTIVINVIILNYILFRSFVIPVKKGASIKYLLQGNFILILIFSFLLDLLKIFAFLPSSVK
jgi:hypothetical protein